MLSSCKLSIFEDVGAWIGAFFVGYLNSLNISHL